MSERFGMWLAGMRRIPLEVLSGWPDSLPSNASRSRPSLREQTLADVLGERAILLANLDDEVREPIERSLARRGLIGAHLEGGSVRLLQAPPHLQTTFEAALARGEFRTTDVAADLGLGVPACNNRLKPLVAAGLLTRRRQSPRAGGREFTYRVPFSPSDARLRTPVARG